MAKRRTTRSKIRAPVVTADRAARLYQLVQLLGEGTQTRDQLVRRLRLDVRGFYRDLKLLRTAGISVRFRQHEYCLEGKVLHAVARLPFPDAHLTLGDALQLAKGHSAAHAKLKSQIAMITR